MTLLPFITLFSSTLILGTLIALRGNHWIFVWIGLELNLISFIPLITVSSFNQERESAIKYFLAQALGSGFILLAGLSIYYDPSIFIVIDINYSIMLVLGLLIKLGLPPCHHWFPSVISKTTWPVCLVLSTWQKLVPIIILFYLMELWISMPLILIIFLSSFIGGLGGINQTQLRPLLAYSSIGHISWIISSRMVSFFSSVVYFMMYIIITAPLILLFHFSSSFLSSSINKISIHQYSSYLWTTLLILSLGGVPPLLGFFPKWIVIQTITSLSLLLVFILLLGSVINLFYYLNLIFIGSLRHTPSSIVFTRDIKIPLTLLIGSTLTLGIAPIFFIIV